MVGEKRPLSLLSSCESWTLKFHQTYALRTLIEVVGNVISRVNIKIINDDSFTGISVESIDSKRVCLVAAKLKCDVVGLDKSSECPCFCVDTSTLGTCLRSVSPQYSIDVHKRVGSEEIVLCVYEVICNSYTSEYKIPTLAHEDDEVKLHDMEYKYQVDFDLVTLRGIVKNCLALKGENVSIIVEESTSNDDTRHAVMTVMSEGNAEQRHVFHSLTEKKSGDDGSPLMMRATNTEAMEGVRTDEEMVTTYHETFSAAYLNSFMKNMERNSVTMRLSSKKPLLLIYPLGIEKSNICFVLAAKADE